MTATVASVNLAIDVQEWQIRHWLARHQYNRPNEKPLRCSGCSKLAEDGYTKCESCLKRQREERTERIARRQAVGHA